ncbi:ATP-dependent DNA ligase Cdc17 [Conglomerata obtusa]
MNNNSFLALSTTLDQISNTKKRLEIQAILTSYLKSLGRDRTHLTSALYLLTASFYPDFYNKELGVGEITLIRLVSGTTGRKITKIREEMRQTGDLGQIAMKYRISTFVRATVPLSTCEVLSALRAISEIQGKDSLNEKIDMMVKLVVRSVGVETKYLIRMFEGKLKIGLALKTVLISLASCFKGLCDDKTAVENVKFAYNQCPIFETIVEELINHGSIGILNYVKIKPGVPVKPMLAQPSKNLTAAYKRFENSLFTCEFKYDGERAQIHKFGKTFKVFSRNSEDLTEKYPDLKEILGSIEKYQNDFILDAEVVAYSVIEQKILPFQLLTTRKRKDVKIDEIKVKICLFIFDCLFYQDSLLEFTLQQRREILLINFNRIQDSVHFVTQINCTSVEEIDNFFNESINSGCEGLMVKKLDSYYKPSMRSSSWIKLKKDYLEGMSETLDLLVMGAYYGKGKRTGTYGGFLIGCYDNENDCYEAVCKIGTGFDDETLKKLHKEIKNFIVKVPQNYVYKESIKPDLWIRARIIFEVRAAGFSVSPIYSAAHRLNNGNGISLRFPRMIRIRDDKGLKDVTSSKQILFMLKEFSTDNESSDDLFN